MFEPRYNILLNVRTNVRKYVVTWIEHSRESNRPALEPLLAELSIDEYRFAGFVGSVLVRFSYREPSPNCPLYDSVVSWVFVDSAQFSARI